MALFACAATGFTAWAGGAAAQAPVNTPSTVQDGPEGGDIVVTARLRQERIADVPLGITAISGQALADDGLSRIQQLALKAPSLSVSSSNPRQTTVAIRGIGNNAPTDGLSSSVGFYLDGIYLDRPGMAAFDLADVDQVEVLRGPQGTLFGKNTTAGAISVTTAAPSFTPGGTASVDVGNYDLRLFQASVTAPITGTLAFRASGYTTDRSGYVRNVLTGGAEASLHREGARLQLLFKPSDTVSWRLIGEYGREKDSSGVYVFTSTGPSTSANTRFVPFAQWAANLGVTPAFDPKGYVTDENIPQSIYQRQYALTSLIDVKLGDYTLSSLTGYRDWKFVPVNDQDWTRVDVLRNLTTEDHEHQFSQELRLASPTGRTIDFVAGAYYFTRQLDNHFIIAYGSQYSVGLGALGNAALNNGTTNQYGDVYTHSYALYGQTVWHLTPKLDLTAGYRESYERAGETLVRTPFTGGTGTAPAALAAYSGTLAIAHWTPSALGTISYKPTEDVLLYALVSHSEKAGGFNSPAVPISTTGTLLPLSNLAVDPEKATNYELGLKLATRDRRVSFDANLFWTNVLDYQANTYISTPFGSAAVIANAGSVRSRGTEVQLSWRPTTQFAFQSSASYNDATYHSFVAAPAVQGSVTTTQDLSGRPVVQSPRWIWNSAATYTMPLGSRDAIYLNAEVNYRSGFYAYIDDSPYVWQNGFALLNARLGVKVADGRYDLSGWLRNAGDHRYFPVMTVFPAGAGGYIGNPAEPRTYGISLRARF